MRIGVVNGMRSKRSMSVNTTSLAAVSLLLLLLRLLQV
jgi:hypothetical protein